jgi:hypothetical protein
MSILLLINDSFGKVEARKRRHDASDIIHGDVRTCTRHFAPVEHAKYIHGKGRKCCKAAAKSNAGHEPSSRANANPFFVVVMRCFDCRSSGEEAQDEGSHDIYASRVPSVVVRPARVFFGDFASRCKPRTAMFDGSFPFEKLPEGRKMEEIIVGFRTIPSII